MSRISIPRRAEMKQMPIVWKRLVKGGETCTRCGNTGRELEAAVAKLAASLRPLGIEPKATVSTTDTRCAGVRYSYRITLSGKNYVR